MGADYSFYVKTIETNARAFFKVIIFSIGSVCCDRLKDKQKAWISVLQQKAGMEREQMS